MQHDPMKQWQELGELSRKAVEELAALNMAAFGSLLKGPGAWTGGEAAALGKQSLTTAQDINTLGTDALTHLLRAQLDLLDTQSVAQSVKELGEINAAAVSRLIQTQLAMVSVYMDATAKHVETLKAARGVEDVVNAQSALFSELQERLKDSGLETLKTLESIKSALGAWVERRIDDSAGEAGAGT